MWKKLSRNANCIALPHVILLYSAWLYVRFFCLFFSDSASNSREKSKRVRDERINTYIVRIIISLLEYLLHSSEMRTHTNHVDFEPVYIET